jgi:O-antigen/teichoic acid export membrane protein
MSSINTQSLLARYSILFTANFLAAISGFLVVVLLARHFGPSGFGKITLAVSIVGYMLVAATFGLNVHAVRAVANGKSSLEDMIPMIITIRLALAILSFLVIAASAYAIPMLYESRYLIFLFGVTLFSDILLMLWVPQTMHRTNIIAATEVLRPFLNLLLLYVLLLLDSSLYLAPIAKVTADILAGIGLILFIRRHTGALKPVPGLGALKSVLRESAPIGVSQVMRTFALATDLIILGLMTGYVEVGVYAAAYRFFLFFLTLGGAYFVILLPRLATISNSVNLLKKELHSSFQRVLPLLGIGLIGVFLSADFLILTLFGDGYSDAGGVLRILSVAAAVSIVARQYRQVLLVKNMQTVELRWSTISAAAHVLSKIVLIPAMGTMGCALGTLIGELFLFFGQRRAVRNVLVPSEKP